jgi:hypothetical protein
MARRAFAACIALLLTEGCSLLLVPAGVGSPLGRSARTANYIATLIVAQEPYPATLNRNPKDDRFRVTLLLNPLENQDAGQGAGRMIPIAGGLPYPDLRQGTGVLGDDGRILWFVASGIGGFDLRTEKLVTSGDLQRANPSLNLDNVRSYDLGRGLRLNVSDGRVFEIDGATLRAVELHGEDARVRARPNPAPEEYLRSGGLLSQTEWLGVHTQAEVARDFKAGSSISSANRAEKSRSPRSIYHGRIDTTPYGPRVLSMAPLAGEEYLNGALLAGSTDSAPMRLSQPDGFLMTYLAKPGGTLFLARVDLNGKRLWTADTGIADLDQILPDAQSIALIGKKPRIPDKVPEPVLAIVNNRSGSVSSRSLWH